MAPDPATPDHRADGPAQLQLSINYAAIGEDQFQPFRVHVVPGLYLHQLSHLALGQQPSLLIDQVKAAVSHNAPGVQSHGVWGLQSQGLDWGGVDGLNGYHGANSTAGKRSHSCSQKTL